MDEKEFDHVQFEDLCELHCTQQEIASVMRMHRNTLRKKVQDHYERPYEEVHEEMQARGRPSLRRTQRALAERNPAMAIWLGKHWLGQKEEVGLGVNGGVVFELMSYGQKKEGEWRKPEMDSEGDSDT